MPKGVKWQRRWKDVSSTTEMATGYSHGLVALWLQIRAVMSLSIRLAPRHVEPLKVLSTSGP